ncbi:MAG: aminotransferase class I/II-fold pyridoxal phosphate-dependent enzyme [Rickettsiales bacterium]|nr:aminotransferase class I/II-fold pyridoxal phosphate-dependent enzyme [Rickettsiales bacterium]
MTLSGTFLAERNIYLDPNEVSMVVSSYPSHDLEEKLKRNLLEFYGIKYGKIVLGAGCNGIIQNLAKVLFRDKGELLTSFYVFHQMEYAVNSLGGRTISIGHNDDFSVDFDRMKENINRNTRAIFLCNPNNPTGFYERMDKIIDLARYAKNIPIILDESCIDFSEEKSILGLGENQDNLIVVNSLSKSFGLAGLRIGYGLFSEKFYNLFVENTSRYEISNLSLYYANFCFDRDLIAKNIRLVIDERELLRNAMGYSGIDVIESHTNTLMTKNIFSDNFFHTLEENGVSVVRVRNELGKHMFRIAVQNPETNRKFINVLKMLRGKYENITRYEF